MKLIRISSIILIPVGIVFLILSAIIWKQQDVIVQELIANANKDFRGTIQIHDSHISPFAAFPYISIDLEDLEIFEGKIQHDSLRILHVNDAYLGFNIWDIAKGNFIIKSIELSEGDIRIIQHKDGNFNITQALESEMPSEEIQEDFPLDIQSMVLNDMDVSKKNEENGVMIDAYITHAESNFKTTDTSIEVGLATQVELSVIKDRDTTFIKRKNIDIDTELNIDKVTSTLNISPTEVLVEGASFNLSGSIALTEEMFVHLLFSGNKPDFNLFLALAPNELKSTLAQFDNKGKIYFSALVKGKAGMGNDPYITAKFGCEDGYFNNHVSGKKLDAIGFRGSFNNGILHKPSTMRFELENFSARPEAGTFSGKLVVENFEAPEIDMKLMSDFDLDFLARFLNFDELNGLSGRVKLTMNFRDIIDLEHPEKSIEKLNESYYSELDIQNLSFSSDAFHVPLKDLDLRMHSEGHIAEIEYLNIKVGNSDIHIDGSISDLPAVLHHTDIPVTTLLNVSSTLLDIEELTSANGKDSAVHEQIDNLQMKLKFVCSAKSITESPTLPIGNFFIDDLYAKLKHYPHTLHDFTAQVHIDTHNIKVKDFSGFIDQSDFHFSGGIQKYGLWFDENKQGDTEVDVDLRANTLQFHDLFSYGGENYVPEDYRHEEIKNLHIHAKAALHFKDSLYASDVYLTALEGKMKLHPLKFEKFNGAIHLENNYLKVSQLKGRMGNSDLMLSVGYYLGEGKPQKRNSIVLHSNYLNLNDLLNVNLPEAKSKPVQHDSVFSIYDFDFPDLDIQVKAQQLIYQNYNFSKLKTDIRMQSDHFIYLDTCGFDAAGGHIDISGYFSGKDKAHIYFSPTIKVKNVDLDKFMVKFDNFGQDHVVSENLHGKFSGTIKGKIHVHADFVPKLDDSDLTIEMLVKDGRLENYGPMLAMTDYFQESKLKSVVFDTLRNTLVLTRGVLEIPVMTINSNLGFLEISGKQKIEDKMDMDYVIGVPWRMVSQAAYQKLFKSKSQSDTTNSGQIQYRDEKAKMLYVRVSGDPDDYKMSLSKKAK